MAIRQEGGKWAERPTHFVQPVVCLEVEGALAPKRSPALVKKEVVIVVAVARQIGVRGLGCPVDVHPKPQAGLSGSSWKSAQDGCGEVCGVWWV